MTNGATGSASVVTVGPKKCKPFILDVMIYSPESGHKAVVSIERACTPSNDSIWKFVFDLYKKKAFSDDFDQLVHVSYRGLNAAENQAIAGMVNGLSDTQADQLPALHDASKTFAANPSDSNKNAVTAAAKGVVTASIEPSA